MKELIRRTFAFILLTTFILIIDNQKVFAGSTDVMNEFDFDDIEEFINNDEDLEDINFKEIANDFMLGDANGGLKEIWTYVKDVLFDEIINNFRVLKKILYISILAAILTNFMKVLKNGQVSDTGFIVCYMVIISLVITSFTALSALAYMTIKRMTEFMKALIPVYMVSVGVSDGQVYAASYYQMALVVITIIDICCLKLLLPIIDIYVVLSIVSNLHSEDYLSKACTLIKNITSFSVKAMLSVVMAINVIRQMFSPVSDGIRNTTVTNVLGIVSGMGNSAGNIASLVYGTGNILKSAIGGAGLIVLMMIVLIPIVKIVIFVFSYQFTNAFLQPVSDDRIIKCMEGISEGAILMLRIVFSVSLMFVITIAIVCMGNSGGVFIKDVIREIAVFTIFINIVSCIIPGDNYKRYLKLISGIIIIIIVMKPIFRYTDGNELYNAFIKEYEKNQVVELDKSLRNLNKKIADITISDYEREVSEDIVTFLTKKGFKVSDVDISLIVDDDNRLGVKKLLIEFEDMNYDKNLREATTIYIDDIILEKYNIDKEVIEIKY